MGAITDEAEDRRAVDMLLHDMPEPARNWIRHHFRNSLLCIVQGIELGDQGRGIAQRAAEHMEADLERIGC